MTKHPARKGSTTSRAVPGAISAPGRAGKGLIRSFDADFKALLAGNGDRTALIVPTDVDAVRISYDELDVLTRRCLKFYEERGLRPGDAIFSLMPNAAETVVCFLASILGGYGFAPLPCVASAREIDRWCGLVRPKLCLTTDLIGPAERRAVETAAVPTTLVPCDAEFAWLPTAKSSRPRRPGARVYLSTSGTTGEPKAMVLDSNRLWSSGRAFLNFHGLLDSRPTFWNYLPMSYLGGLFNLSLIPLCAGGTSVIDETFSGKTVLQFWQTVERFGIDALWLVPAIARGLLAMARRTGRRDAAEAGRRIKAAFIGTAPLELETKLEFERTFGFKVLENFALSETTFFSSETPDDLKRRSEGSVGRVLPYAEVRFAPTEEGSKTKKEILVRSPFLFLGYLQPGGALGLPVDRDGFLPTGDVGALGRNGILSVTGRIKEFVKKGGYLVPLREIETLAQQHPSVREAAALRTRHEFYGESFDLYLILNEGRDESALPEIRRYLHENLVKYKWPERMVVVKEFPRTASGKIRKHLLARVPAAG